MKSLLTSRFDRWSLGLLLFLCVGLMPLLLGLARVENQTREMLHIEGSGYLALVTFLPILFWAFLPGRIFGETFFSLTDFGYWPRGVLGWLVVLGFYAGVAITCWAFILYVRHLASGVLRYHVTSR